ncbi:MAG: PAS domain S-box protein [Chloroflexi bacterium]|nr:PAS domain S-box protein [Chloroflexota bacterium]
MPKVQRTVMIIDDAQSARDIIRHALRQDANIDYQFIEAENGEQALTYLRQQQPACLLLNCQLSDTDGLTLLQTVVQQAAPHIYPIVMLAGPDHAAVAMQAMQQGAHDFLPKAALTVEQVQRAVNNATEKVTLLRQVAKQREWSRLNLASMSNGVSAIDEQVLGVAEETTEHKQTIQTLQASGERYRTLFEAMDEGFSIIEMIFDAADQPVDYRFLEINPAFERFTGLEQAVGKTARQLVPNLEKHWFEIYGDIALTGEPQRFVEGSEAMGRWFDVYAFRFGEPESRRVAVLFNNITERKQAEDQLRRQEELLRLITDNVPGLIGYIGTDERYRFVNATFETWFQRSRQQIIGSSVTELIGDEDWARLSIYRNQALAGDTVSYETMFAYPDGITRAVWGRYQPHIGADGTVLGFYLFLMDISERKRAEQHQKFLSELGMQLRLLRDTDAIMTQLVSRLGQHLQVAGCRINEVDLTNQQFSIQKDWVASGKPVAGTYALSELAPPTILAELAKGETVAVANTETDPRTTPVAENYQAHQVTSFIGVPMFRHEQWIATLSVKGEKERHWRQDEIQLLEAIAGQFWPLLERVRAEEALRIGEERLRLALAGGGLGIWEWQIPTDTFTWTEQEFVLFGLAPDMPMTQERFNSLIHHEDRAEITAALDRLATDGGDYTGEFRIIHSDGQVRWLAERCVAICDAQGQPVRLLGVNFDITKRKQAEQALHQFNEQLEQQVKARTAELTKRLQELDQFAYVTSHDLKAPLRAIDHLARWINDDAGSLLPPSSRGHLEKIQGRIKRMEKLLDDLLTYSRADRYQYATEKVNVALLLDDIIRLVTPPQGFAVSTQTSLPLLITQRVPLETVLRNLINNAIKHHDRSDGQVRVVAQDRGEFFEFSVSDDGPGIAPEFHERIFQLFQTLKPRDQVEGSGMGLAIVKKIVESHHGRITVSSTLGKGATFHFTWPKT